MHIFCGVNCKSLVETQANWYSRCMKDKFWAKKGMPKRPVAGSVRN